jgi:hypothetical protein
MKVWFEKHRDFALGLGYWGSAAIYIFILILTISLNQIDWIAGLSTAIWLAFVAWLEVWYLKQKARNPWNAVWVFIWGPIGVLILYNLKNKKI